VKSRMNKRGSFFFPLYAVFLTLFMCGIVVGLYLHQQETVENSLVSPKAVLEVRDNLTIFEMREKNLIIKSSEGVDFGSDGFEDKFKDNFFDGYDDDDMREFIFGNLVWDGNKIDRNLADEDSFLRNVLYFFNSDGDKLILKRTKIGKEFLLVAEDDSKTDYPIGFKFEFERGYIISKRGGEVEIK